MILNKLIYIIIFTFSFDTLSLGNQYTTALYRL
jgi:hypothetical protein